MALWLLDAPQPRPGPSSSPGEPESQADSESRLAPAGSLPPGTGSSSIPGDLPGAAPLQARGRTEVQGELQAAASDLWVLVRNYAGEPAAGVPLELEGFGIGQRSGADGRACFPAAGEALAGAEAPVRLIHALPFAEPPVLAFDPGAVPGELLESQLPPSGELEIVALELDGRPAPENCRIEIGLAGERGAEGDVGWPENGCASRSSWAASIRWCVFAP